MSAIALSPEQAELADLVALYAQADAAAAAEDQEARLARGMIAEAIRERLRRMLEGMDDGDAWLVLEAMRARW